MEALPQTHGGNHWIFDKNFGPLIRESGEKVSSSYNSQAVGDRHVVTIRIGWDVYFPLVRINKKYVTIYM